MERIESGNDVNGWTEWRRGKRGEGRKLEREALSKSSSNGPFCPNIKNVKQIRIDPQKETKGQTREMLSKNEIEKWKLFCF